MKTAIVFGATGLVGSHIVKQLINSDDYGKIKVFGRREMGYTDPKVEEYIISFDRLADVAEDIKGHVVYCCLGTTIKKAKNEVQYRKVDYDMPVDIAHIAEKNGIDSYIVVSSIGASLESKNFYLHMKAEMETTLKRYNFKRLKIVRPSFLLGTREEFRFKEWIGKSISWFITPLMVGKLKKYRPIHAKKVAAAMIRLGMDDSGQQIFESDEL